MGTAGDASDHSKNTAICSSIAYESPVSGGCSDLMDCPECLRLTTEYETVEMAYAAAVGEVPLKRGTVSAEEYERLSKRIDQTSLDLKVAGMMLAIHNGVYRDPDIPDLMDRTDHARVQECGA